MKVGPKQIVMMRYLQTLAPVGQWFTTANSTICDNLGVSFQLLDVQAKRMVEKGIIERRKIGVNHWRYRLLVSPDAPDIEIVEARYNPSIHAKAGRKPKDGKPRKLLHYAGWERGAPKWSGA